MASLCQEQGDAVCAHYPIGAHFLFVFIAGNISKIENFACGAPSGVLAVSLHVNLLNAEVYYQIEVAILIILN